MRIDPKYFNTFLLIVAIVAAGLIAFFTLSNRSDERADFTARMMSQDSLSTVWWSKVQTDDSLRISDFNGQVIVLDFWSTWSDASLESHRELTRIQNQYSDSLKVIAAAVGMQKEEVISYMEQHQFPFQFVAGSHQFSAFNIPGLPAQMIYDPQGKMRHVFLGFPDKSQYDSLRTLLRNGR